MNDEVYEDDRKVIAKCSFCGCDLHGKSENFYADEMYFDHGTWCCENCTSEFLEQFRVGKDY